MPRPIPNATAILGEILDVDRSIATSANVVRFLLLGPRSDADATNASLLRRATDCFAALLEAAACGDPPSLQDVLSTDQVCIQHAILLLREHHDSTAMWSNYIKLEGLTRSAGLPLFANEDSRPAAEVLFRSLGGTAANRGRDAEQRTTDSLSLLHRFNPSRALSFAITLRAQRRIPVQQGSLVQILHQAGLLSATRRRNFSDAGLLWLAHRLLFPAQDLAFVSAWASRVRRPDGLWGPWELFEDLVHGGNLAASVNMTWACSSSWPNNRLAPTDGMEPDLSVQSVSVAEVERAIADLMSWIETELSSFELGPLKTEAQYGDRIKPLVELVLALWLLGSHRKQPDDVAVWARTLGARLRPVLTEQKYVEALRIFPTTALAALVYPMLEDLLALSSPYREEVLAIARAGFSAAQERIPMRQMDYWFLRLLFDPSDGAARAGLDKALSATLLYARENPALFSNDSLYDITHAIFYATGFGTLDHDWPEPVLSWCKTYIPMLSISAMMEGDYDLGAEFVLNWLQLGLEIDNSFHLAVRMLLAGIEETGALPGPRRIEKYETLSPFERNYHTTLVGLAALVATRDKLRGA